MNVRELAREEYPAALREIPQVPPRLWIRGALPPAGTKYLAVVGSRALSRYGAEACTALIQGLSGYPLSIVSGLALGADACAHRAALSAGLPTVAIPGSGLDDSVIAPRTNLGLAQEILAKGGALLSEHEPQHLARPFDFPSRNRIMAGMADAVLIIEARERSGTLITARLAGEYNRDLLVIPHRIGDPQGYGPHLFARLGATLVTEARHILEALHIKVPESEPRARTAPADLSETELLVWNLLSEPRERDALLRAGGTAAGEFLAALMALEVRGLIREEFGAWRRI